MLKSALGHPVSPEPDRSQGTTRILEVYALPGCPGWRRALTLATMARLAAVPGVEVVVQNMSAPETRVPEAVVASPTWVLDGRRIALGNPDPEWLLKRLGVHND